MFIDGFLALATAFPTPATITEYVSPTYHRQPVSFDTAVKGVARNVTPVSFGFSAAGSIVGFGLFDSPGGGVMLLALPFFSPAGYGSQPAACEAASICLLFNDLIADPTGAALSYAYAPATAIGAIWRDPADFIGVSSGLSQAGVTIPGGPVRQFAMGTMTSGTSITIKRGVLSASEMA